jgi:hypothetical protein
MSKKSQFGKDDTAELSRVSGGEVQTVVDPATISALVSAGALVLDFIGHLVGGKTGAALSGLSAQIDGLSTQLMSIAAKAQEIIMKVEETITAVDTQSLAMASPVHDQVLAYSSAFPQGVPATADTKNPSYVFADNNSKTAITYFQDIGPARGPIAFMPSLCHVTNTRMEVAVSCWQCWWLSDSAHPNYATEINVSAGHLDQKIQMATPGCGAKVVVKAIKGKVSVRDDGNDPPDPQGTIGWQVIDDGKVVFSKLDPNALAEANRVAGQLRADKATQILGNFRGVHANWVNAVAGAASAGIQRALNLGDAKQFMRYVNPGTLAMVDHVGNGSKNGTTYRTLPLRDILLDMLTSGQMKHRHGLLVKGADTRSVKFWFDKTFHREPSPSELRALLKVVEIFGYDSLFGCLAYSDEYEKRYGDGIPSLLSMENDLAVAQQVIA